MKTIVWCLRVTTVCLLAYSIVPMVAALVVYSLTMSVPLTVVTVIVLDFMRSEMLSRLLEKYEH